MKIGEMFFKIFAVAAALTMVLALSGCGQKENDDGVGGVSEPSETVNPNIPQHTVPPHTVTEAPSTSPDDASVDNTLSDASEANIPDNTAEPTESTPAGTAPTAGKDEDHEEVPEEPDTRAIACLKLFNSSKVHAKFVAAISYDGSEILTTSVEYYINGSERVYITDGTKTMIRDGMTTVVDNDAGIYYSYPEDGIYGLDFGFERSKYMLVSQNADEEVYKIDGTDITSTWTFRGDGTVRVADRASDGSFTLYDVEVIESDISMMDFSIPSSYEEVDAGDYEFYR